MPHRIVGGPAPGSDAFTRSTDTTGAYFVAATYAAAFLAACSVAGYALRNVYIGGTNGWFGIPTILWGNR